MNASEASSKRMFLKLALAMNAAVCALLSVPVFRYLLSPATRHDQAANRWIELGAIDKFPVGETRLASFRNSVVKPSDGDTANLPCWVRRVDASTFQVFAINCAHLGCPVRWFPESNLFMCPCHGGAYYADGSRASGPPERGLFEYPYRIAGGVLSIRAEELPTPGALALDDGKRRLPCA